MTRRPNVLWIVSDHQIYATRPSQLELPPLQRKLARLGVEFSQARTVLPVCSPARASMLTGLYPHAHGLTENDGRFGGRSCLDPAEWMIHRPLLDAGYRCAWFGKWHVDNRRSAQEYGFEGFSLPGYGYPYESDTYCEYLSRNGVGEPAVTIEIAGESGVPPGTEINLAVQKQWFDYESGSAILRDQVEAHEAFFLADLAQRWLGGVGDTPFFLRVDTWGPHPPYVVGGSYLDMFSSSDIQLPHNFYCDLADRPSHHRDYRNYWRDTLKLDESEWRLMFQRALEHGMLVETALCKLLDHIDLDNTVVVFNSDHGDAIGSNGAVANKGGMMVEATMQIPLLMAGAGLPENVQRDQLVSNLDLPPTIASLCRINADGMIQGESLLPVAQEAAELKRTGFLAQHYGLHEPVMQRAWYEDDWKLIVQSDGFQELYRLSSDPEEMSNLAHTTDNAERIKVMRRNLQSAMDIAEDRAFVM